MSALCNAPPSVASVAPEPREPPSPNAAGAPSQTWPGHEGAAALAVGEFTLEMRCSRRAGQPRLVGVRSTGRCWGTSTTPLPLRRPRGARRLLHGLVGAHGTRVVAAAAGVPRPRFERSAIVPCVYDTECVLAAEYVFIISVWTCLRWK